MEGSSLFEPDRRLFGLYLNPKSKFTGKILFAIMLVCSLQAVEAAKSLPLSYVPEAYIESHTKRIYRSVSSHNSIAVPYLTSVSSAPSSDYVIPALAQMDYMINTFDTGSNSYLLDYYIDCYP